MSICPRCGAENAEQARFCSGCGAALAATGAGAEVRKVVTVVFCDVANSTRLGERLDPEAHRRVMGRYFEAMRGVLERHGGTVEKFIGDAVMAVFGIPVVHEDDALRAVRAATEMREALTELNRELRRDWDLEIAIRTGVNTGEVVAGEPGAAQTLITGDAVVVAKRLEETAAASEIQVGEGTYRLVREAVLAEPVGPVQAKGKPSIPAWRLLAVRPGAEVTPVRLDSPLVGRELDLGALQEMFERAVAERSCRLFTVLGPAGIGKSRLVHELVSWLADRALVLRGHCLPYGEGITFWPLVEVVKQAAGLTDRDSSEDARRKIATLLPSGDESTLIAGRVAAAVGRGEAASARPEETFWAVRRLLEALAAERPLVVVFDDIQWAETTFLDLVEYVAGWSTNAPILICCLARPELLELRPSWGRPRPNAAAVLLGPLRESETEELIANLLGRLPLPRDVQTRIATIAEGNPLFVEELLRMLRDDGLLQRENGGWRAAAGLGELAVPPTIHALLAARLDRLEPDERATIQRAAVAGQVFWWGAVTELTPERERAGVGSRLQSLVRKELIRHEGSTFAAEDAFRFGHILIRDAAYAALSKEARAELHERLARWLERKTHDQTAEYEEILGYHLEQAFSYRREMGHSDDAGRALALQAAERLASAGRRALARADAPAAASLLERAIGMMPDAAPERLELLVELAGALHEVGELQRARKVLKEALDRSVAAGDRRLEASVLLEFGRMNAFVDPESEAAGELFQAAERAAAVFESLGDDAGLARALVRMADAHWLRCHVTPMEPLLERALVHARRAGDMRELSNIHYARVRAAALGPMPVGAAIELCRHVLEEAAGDRLSEAVTANALAYLEAMSGRFDVARELVARSRAILEDLGMVMMIAALNAWSGQVEMLAGDLPAAERLWRTSYDTLERLGEKGNLSTIAAFLAEALYLQGRDEEAQRFTEVSEKTSFRDDVTTQIAWRVTRAKVRSRRGELAEARDLAQDAVARAEETDWPTLRGAARMSLAEVLFAAGQGKEASQVAQEALEIYEAKGNVAAVAAVRAFLEEALSAGAVPGDRAS